MSSVEDLAHEIHTHLLYELTWLIYAAARFAEGHQGDPVVALVDSAAIHSRNLFEFADRKDEKKFTLHALGGTAKASKPWDHWANNRVTHMLEREHNKAPWPAGLDNGRQDRLMVMAGAVLDRLEDGGTSIPAGPVREAFIEVVGAARRYWAKPSAENHALLAALYDDSRDGRSAPY